MTEPKPKFPLTNTESALLKRLVSCTFGIGSPDKRFVRDLQDASEMTGGQLAYLARLVYRYRGQLRLSDLDAKDKKEMIEARLIILGVKAVPEHKVTVVNMEELRRLEEWNKRAKEFTHTKTTKP
jgi:hypothetical protein